MSDGGATAVVEGVRGLAQFKVGRVVLWAIAVWLGFSALTGSGRDRDAWLLVAVVLAAVALIAGFIAERRKRAERASLKLVLAVVGLVVAGGVGLLLALARRRRGVAAVAAPMPDEVDAEARGS